MEQLGLALSGGGFRATLYHLGVVRLLRDAGILSKITHINTVSGGSILGAHLALNWDKYCGSSEQFDEAASEVLDVVRMDVRNRIVRRFPFATAVNALRAAARMGTARQLTRPGLLENYYERFLYGDVPLSDLPLRPRLHILATNLSEGCLCSFNRDGLLLQRRTRGRRDHFERIQMGLATVPMAVAASSAFPGFFPPLELSGWEVGADEGEFNRQNFTDGGVYDNLGLRMFRCLEQSWVRDAAPLQPDDILQIADVISALSSATSMPQGTPLRRLREKLDSYDQEGVLGSSDASQEKKTDAIVRGLWELIRSERLYREECFRNVELADDSAQSLLNYLTENGREPDSDNRAWLNRQIIESSLRQVIGKPCLRMSRRGFDGVLVSDAGGKFKVSREVRKGGLIRTALRSSDILMDRVWQLELEAFANTPGVVFFPISHIVSPSKDRTALDPEVQRQTSLIRTDLDRFTDLEISSLIRHGYCVGRSMIRPHAERLGIEIPSGSPWDPTAKRDVATARSNTTNSRAAPALDTARELQCSSRRKIWSTLINLNDWPSYVWIALVMLVAVSVPWYVLHVRERAHQQKTVLQAIADMSPDYSKILRLMRSQPQAPTQLLPVVEVESMEEVDLTGFQVLSDTRIFDLRGWEDPDTPAISFSRLTIARTEEGSNNTRFKIQRRATHDTTALHCPSARLNPRLSQMDLEDGSHMWELDLDFSRVPIDGKTDVEIHALLPPEIASSVNNEGRFNFTIPAKTALLEVWMLLPMGKVCDSFEVVASPLDQPELSRIVVPHSRVQLAFGSIATFRMINPEPGFRYECRWTWENEGVGVADSQGL